MALTDIQVKTAKPKEKDYKLADGNGLYTRYRISCGVADNDKAFHSFRHTTLDFFKQHKEFKEISKAIAGHKNDDITTGLYGKSYEPSTLVSAIESLVFPIEIKKYESFKSLQ